MPLPYFLKFPQISYDVTGTGTEIDVVTNIMHHVEFLSVVKANTLIFYPYFIKEGETPEIIASKLYGSSNFHWVVLFSNGIFNLWTEWPLDYYQFQAYITNKYGSVPTAQTTIDHYEDNLGAWIDVISYSATIDAGSQIIYAYDYETTLNDNKRNIQLIDPKYVATIDAELNSLLTPSGKNKMLRATDFDILSVVVTSVNGTQWDLSTLMVEMNVYEDISHSTISADMVIDDADNRIQNIPLTGHEWINISFSTPGTTVINITLRIYKISNRELEKERRQLFILHCVDGVEFLNAQKRVSKAYTKMLISDIANDIQTNYLDSTFFFIEPTKNLHSIIPANWSPLRTINFLCSRANSAQYLGANYVYFQTTKGFNFASLENLVDIDPKTTYLYQPANIRDQNVVVGTKPRTLETDIAAIQSYKFVSNFDTLENASQGMYGNSLLWYDLHTKTFGEDNFDYPSSYDNYNHIELNNVHGGSSYLWTSRSDINGKYGALKMMSIGQPESLNFVRNWLSIRLSQMQQIQNARLRITVPGDSRRTAGDLISVTLPSPEGLTDDQLNLDAYYTGNYLVTGLRHFINKKQYLTVLDLCKDSVFSALP